MKTFATGLFAYFFLLVSQSGLAAQSVEIRIRETPLTLSAGTIRIQDVAELSGGDYRTRQKIASLDLDDVSQKNDFIEISADRIRYRILLAGIPDRDFFLTGGNALIYLLDRNSLADKISSSVRSAISHHWQVPLDQLEVALISPVEGTLLRSGLELQSLQIQAELPAEFPQGQRHLRIIFSDGFGKQLKTTLSFKFEVYRDLVMVKEDIRKGELLDENRLTLVRRPVGDNQVRYVSYDQALGQTVKNDLKKFELIDAQSLISNTAPPEPTAKQDLSPRPTFDIKRNEPVNLVIRQGGLSVTLRDAKAVQNGRVGETLEFINPSTKKRIAAKLIDSKTAVVDAR